MIKFSMRYMFAIIFTLLTVTYLFFFNEMRDYKNDLPININSYIEGLRIVSKKDGIDSWVIVAKRANFTRDETVAKMDSVAINVIKEGIVLNADKGSYDMTTKDLQLDDNIKINIKGSVISVKNLLWNSSNGELKTDGSIKMEGNKFKIEGEGLTATQDQKIKLLKNVKATFF